MTFTTLIFRSLRYHLRAHLGVVIGAAIGTAAITGALVVGSSVRASLRDLALQRLGATQFALYSHDLVFRRDLSSRVLAEVAQRGISIRTTAGLLFTGTASRPDASARVNSLQVLGVEESSWPAFAHWRPQNDDAMWRDWRSGKSVLVNETLSRQLRLKAGDTIVLRLRKPGLLPEDAVISPREDNSIALRLPVAGVLSSSELADFNLRADRPGQPNAFVSLHALQEQFGLAGKANLLLVGKADDSAQTKLDSGLLRRALYQTWVPEDAGLFVRPVVSTNTNKSGSLILEIGTSRIFLPDNLVGELERLPFQNSANAANAPHGPPPIKVFTYLVNLLRAGDQSAPYSMVTAADGLYTPADMKEDEIIVNEWLAQDLQVRAGDELDLSYYVIEGGSRLVERTNTFRVRAVVPLSGAYADRTLMPEFPGLAKAETTQDWDAGFPLMYKIRPKDEAYWKAWRGTPKAFLALSAAQRMWQNRFGSATSVRFTVPNSLSTGEAVATLRDLLRSHIDPAALGLEFQPVRENALEAVSQSQDFGGLFLGFSFFLVLAALLLMALLFRFGLEQRMAEIGTFLALGYTPSQVRRLLVAEGALLALLGGALGALAGIVYGRAILWALATVWKDAVGAATLRLQNDPGVVIIGALSGCFICVLTLWLTLRKQARQPARVLLAGGLPDFRSPGRCWSGWVGVAFLLLATSALLSGFAGTQPDPLHFFTAGAALLCAGLSFFSFWLRRLQSPVSSAEALGIFQLALRSCARRRSRSITSVVLLASGTFLIVSLAIFRLEAPHQPADRASGTGGFMLIAQSALPIVQDLRTAQGRDDLGLSAAELKAAKLVPLRVREGDDASCLSLNRAQRPRLLGVDPEDLKGRFTFTATAPSLSRASGWELLRTQSAPDEIPAIGDANSIQWALGKKMGDAIIYQDEQGRSVRIRLVGAVANSVLQGSLIIDAARFTALFPSQSGYHMFLVECPEQQAPRVSSQLSRALQDYGLEVQTTSERLNAFNAVQNTYLGTFQILGGLGLLLGSAGLAIVLLRNVFERRGELALLIAVGFTRRLVSNLVLCEHAALLAVGLALGVLASVVAVLPVVVRAHVVIPWFSLSVTLAAILLNGMLWTLWAARSALRGDLLKALRNE